MKKILFLLSSFLLCLSAMALNTADYNLVSPLPAKITPTDQGPYLINSLKEAKIKKKINKKLAPEAYRLTVGSKGITIEGGSDAGIFYGMNTLVKAIGVPSSGAPLEFPAVVIEDEPRFPYRGMHLDVCRHFFPIEFVKQYIDMLALHNMNTLHFHITDDQGWRFESKKYPRLNSVGSWRDRTVRGYLGSGEYDHTRYGGYYTQDELRDLVKYAAERHVTIVPEIDMPGHMLAALAAYPELGCTGGPYEVCPDWGVFEDVLCIGNDKTVEFLEGVFDELIDIFPSKLIHIGGDECPRDRWAACPKCQARIKTEGLVAPEGHTAEDMLQSWITAHMEKYLNERGRSIIGWDEILNGEVAPSAWVMSWRGSEGGIKAAQMGHDVVMTPNTHCYFDFYQTDDTSDEPLAIGGCTPVEKVYNLDPIAGLTADQAKHIKGVQANLWTEYIHTPDHIEYMVLPRMSALAEVQWTPADKEKNYDEYVRRADNMMKIYHNRGWNYGKHLYNLFSTVTPSEKDRSFIVTFSSLDNAPVHYTLDGSKPTEASPTAPASGVKITGDCVLSAVAIRPDGNSNVVSIPFNYNLATLRPVTYENCMSSPAYTFEGSGILVDGRRGTDNFAAGWWLGYNTDKVTAIVDLGTPTFLSKVKVGSIDYPDAWIMGPTGAEVSVSADGVNFTRPDQVAFLEKVKDVKDRKGCSINDFIVNLERTEARYVKITVTGESALPQGHPAAGSMPFIFLDEIEITDPKPLPITGTFLNLFYQDERNKYMNPSSVDMTDPALWTAKVNELADLGLEYLVIVAVANDYKALYPSKMMKRAYKHKTSPVDAILDAAAARGMKVFMSSGWAKNQDDNLRNPKTKERQIKMMDELASIYGNHPALYGWYLPVEDCLGPVLSEYAVDAVNQLAEHARSLTPGAKILISPYGIFNSKFDHPDYASRIRALKVDIIAYQDEVGCEREENPLQSLRTNWRRLRDIHEGTGIDIWANCETFTWEKEPNARNSALIPAPFNRVREQLNVATQGGVSRIISFAVCGIWDTPGSPYPIGHPGSQAAHKAYKTFLNEN